MKNIMEILDATTEDFEARKRTSQWEAMFPTLYSFPMGKKIKCESSKEYDSLTRYIKKNFPSIDFIGRRNPEKDTFQIVFKTELKK